MHFFELRAKLLTKLIPFIINLFGLDIPPYTSVCAIIKRKNRILAINLSYKSGYSLPGGGMKISETLEEGIAREVKEETNLDISNLKYLFSNYTKEGKFGKLSACFEVKIKDFKRMKGSEEGEVVWITPQKLLANCAYKDVEKHIRQYFKL